MKNEIAKLMEKVSSMERSIKNLETLVGPNATYVGDNLLLTQTLHGVKYYIYADDLISTPNMVIYRQWEANISSLLYKLLDKDSIFVDVGANFGYFTCLAGSLIGSAGAGQIVSIEPNPRMLKLVHRNIRINWSMAPIHVVEGALDEAARDVEMIFPTQLSANASLAKSDWGDEEVDRSTIKCSRLDDLLDDMGIKNIDLIKIDVEGFEFSAFKGMMRVLNGNKNLKVIAEWSTPQMNDAEVDLDEYVGFLASKFTHLYLLEDGLKRVDFDFLRNESYHDILLSNEDVEL